MRPTVRRMPTILAIALASIARLAAGEQGPDPLRADIDRGVREVLAAIGVPGASIAVVRDGKIAYVQAYGDAKLEPRTPARPEMRYSIGSVSKQFTATAILMLAEEGKLSLDDPVGRFLPELARAKDVTIRQLLSHTSGYRDYWPQDYVPPFMLKEITAAGILDLWAKQPLDFEPGTQYQYSNTGYVIAGVIIEKASGMPLLQFLSKRIFVPLGMTSVANIDQERLGDTDPIGYLRYALGPPRIAPKEGKGWLFAAGELAMTAEDLARWNVGILDGKLLTQPSYRQMQTEVLLKNGLGISYGLGIQVAKRDGHRYFAHGGEVSGFTAENVVFPDDRAAVTVLVNLDASEAASLIGTRIVTALFAQRESAPAEAAARKVFEALQHGKIDRSLFTSNANSYFTDPVIQDFAASLGPLGVPQAVTQKRTADRGGMTFRLFEVRFPSKTVSIWQRDMPDGKIEQFQVMAGD
jgi:D-alanyl-D-alanine carboxypeptidase